MSQGIERTIGRKPDLAITRPRMKDIDRAARIILQRLNEHRETNQNGDYTELALLGFALEEAVMNDGLIISIDPDSV